MLKSVAILLLVFSIAGAEVKQENGHPSHEVKGNLGKENENTNGKTPEKTHQPQTSDDGRAHDETKERADKLGEIRKGDKVNEKKGTEISESKASSSAETQEHRTKTQDNEEQTGQANPTASPKVEYDTQDKSAVDGAKQTGQANPPASPKVDSDTQGKIAGYGAKQTGQAKPTASPKVDSDTQEDKVADEVHETKGKEQRVKEDSEETRSLKRRISQRDDTGKHGDGWKVSARCLDCVCRETTGCNLNTSLRGCRGRTCGPFGLSYVFWEDALDYKQPDGPSFEGDAKMEHEWRLCSLDLMCATDTIQKYFNKYPHDCNGDGKVDCLDYAAIHTLGPFGCMKKDNLDFWNEESRKPLLQCMVSDKYGPYATEMMRLEEKLKLQDIAGRKLADVEKSKKSVSEVDSTKGDSDGVETEVDRSESESGQKEAESKGEGGPAVIVQV